MVRPSCTAWAGSAMVATGGTLSTDQVKVSLVGAPLSSVAVMVTVYGPFTDALVAILPVTRPVLGSMLSPGGKPSAANVSVSPAFGSLKAAEASRLTAPLFLDD